MAATRLSPRLRLAPLWPALVALLVVLLVVAVSIPRLLERAAAQQLFDSLELLQATVLGHLEDPPEERQAWLRGLGSGRALRLTVIAANGEVIADSARSFPQVGLMESHLGRPEIAAALATGRGWSVRHSATTGVTYIYAAQRLTAPDGSTLLLRVARPRDRLRPMWGDLAAKLALAAALALAAVLLTGWLLDRRLFRPLARMIASAENLSLERQGLRLSVPNAPELAPLAQAFNRLTGDIEDQMAAVKAERDHLRSIVASMSEGVLVVSQRGRAVLANPALHRLLNFEKEVEGRLPLEITRQRELAWLIEETLASGRSHQAEAELPGPQRRHLALTCAALSGPQGGAVVVARDTTGLIRLTEMRRDFVANVSHELKTPLAAIRGYAETLSSGALDDPSVARRFTERILEQCRRLQALLSDLLVLSRLESPDVPLRRDPVSLDRVAERARDLTAETAAERRIRVEVHRGEEESDLVLQGDAEALERLAVNLLENGIKYNRPGGRVDVRLEAQGDELVMEVSDTGIGIPAEALPRVFERFYRVDKGRSREEGGTGLGLAIVKHVAQSHGGRLEVTSRLGEGSRFRVLLPRSASTPGEGHGPGAIGVE